MIYLKQTLKTLRVNVQAKAAELIFINWSIKPFCFVRLIDNLRLKGVTYLINLSEYFVKSDDDSIANRLEIPVT